MIIKLPYPNKELAPNRANGLHWGKTKAMKASDKNMAFIMTKEALRTRDIKLGATVPLTITFQQADKRHRDLDGLLSASKHYLDGVALALKIDDKQFEPITITRSYEKGCKATIIQIQGII